jgi:UDP-N-acetylmuramoyl-tripeptide--D-alanyl-D-alanine ligase
MTLWTSAALRRATGGFVNGGPWAVTGVSIDSRTVRQGDLFVALKDVRDGHDFVARALENGAAAAMVSRIPEDVARDAPLILVPDVLRGLTALGRAGRRRMKGQVIAVTGSVGKTSTKEMLRCVLERQGRTHAAEASYNNHWGVPLTLARMPGDTEYAIIEIGMNHPGEIAPLARLARPHVALVTAVAAAHLAAFDSIEAIAREKAAIFEGLEPGGVAVVNGDLAVTPILAAAAGKARLVTFGELPANSHRLTHVGLTGGATVVRANLSGQEHLFKITSPGRHFAANALGVLAAVEALGADVTLAARDIETWAPPPGRGTLEEVVLDPVEGHSITLIDDAFNANPTSMAAALEVLAATRPVDGVGRHHKGRRVAILGDMLELGADEAALHSGLYDLPWMARLDLVHCCGPRMKGLWERLRPDQQGEWHENPDTMAARARNMVDAGDVVLVKGSKGSYVSRTVDAIRNLGHPQARRRQGNN